MQQLLGPQGTDDGQHHGRQPDRQGHGRQAQRQFRRGRQHPVLLTVQLDLDPDIARIGEGEELAPGDLVYLVEDAVSLMDMPIRCDLQPLPPVRLKPQAMQRVVINLLENARRYARPEFAVATWQEGERVYLAVTDQGPGIPEEKMGAMFTPFVRGNQARSGVPGAGLGLAIVQKIVHQHGGEVSLHNRPEGGLEVRISLPV